LARAWTTEIQFPAEAMMGFLSLRHRVQTASRAHLPSYQRSTAGSYRDGKAVGAWSWSLTSI